MAKKYRLLKDTPTAEEGTAFVLSKKGYDYVPLANNVCSPKYHKNIVENNPEWFEEVKDESYQDIEQLIESRIDEEIFFNKTMHYSHEFVFELIYRAREATLREVGK